MYITLNGEPIYLKGALDQSFTRMASTVHG